MDKETFNKIVLLNKRLEDLKRVGAELDKYNSFILMGYKYSSGELNYHREWEVRPIEELLKKHYDMIRQEINDEIQGIEDQINEM